MHNGKEIYIYIHSDKTKTDLKMFKKLRNELRLKRAEVLEKKFGHKVFYEKQKSY